jgi:flotillin
VERFLGRSRDDIATVARQTVEATLRGVLAEIKLEAAQRDPVHLADRVEAKCDEEVARLGLELDSFKLERVTPA